MSDLVDLILMNGMIVDGTGKGAYRGDISICEGRIIEIGELSTSNAKKTVDLQGQIIAPGFIDLHTHADSGILMVPTADNYLMQGVTTVIGGNCGGHEKPMPLKEHLELVEEAGTSINYGVMVGHGDIRIAAMEDSTMPPSQIDLDRMIELTDEAMKMGAFGISSGLEYWPGRYATTDELIAVAKKVAEYGGLFASHIRDEQVGVITAVGEAIEIGRRSGASIEISHLKACGASVWGYGKVLVSMVTLARAMGVDIAADQYPYGASNTGFSQCFPSWSLTGGMDHLKDLLADDSMKERIKRYAESQIRIRVGGDLSLVQISHYEGDPTWDGLTLANVLESKGLAVNMDNGINLIVEMFLCKDPSIIYHYIDAADIEAIMRSPFVSVVSDGHICQYRESVPHPRSYGTFARVLSKYVQELNILTLEEAVRKMTSLPASRLGIKDRGVLAPGMSADVVVLDLDEIQDTATFLDPHQYPRGISLVIVNGQVAVDHGNHAKINCGKVLYGPGKQER